MPHSPGQVRWQRLTHTTADGTALGTDVRVVVTGRGCIDGAHASVHTVLEDVDRACSRFRPDSEINRLRLRAGRWTVISELLCLALDEALRAAALTGGLVDPTLGRTMADLGYDADFSEVRKRPGRQKSGSVIMHDDPERVRGRSPRAHLPGPSWMSVELDVEWRRARLPEGVRLDLGATAKGLAADLAAAAALEAIRTGGVLVSLGGDVAVAGEPPAGGWIVQVSDESSAGHDPEAEKISVHSGGVATSSARTRAWTNHGVRLHHILDPRTLRPAMSDVVLATVAASRCVDANAASTCAIVRGHEIMPWLVAHSLPARLVDTSNRVSRVAGWPEVEAA